ncbi:MAG TPA: CHAP domain-containing protein, partial [Candidatus Salinicoccus stercoripullorum]|nr:CHAP domain-containing protein [Candidatus Salinicoccus stercoripullorum]
AERQAEEKAAQQEAEEKAAEQRAAEEAEAERQAEEEAAQQEAEEEAAEQRAAEEAEAERQAEEEAAQQEAEEKAAEQRAAEEAEAERQAEEKAAAAEEAEDDSQAPAPASYGENWYLDGDCTWYVYERRQQMGKPVSNQWGNASNWASAAKSQGLNVSSSPSVGAIVQSNAWTNGAWGSGHVAVVEKVNSDGSILVSEMNWSGGPGNKTMRTIGSYDVSSHNFIH